MFRIIHHNCCIRRLLKRMVSSSTKLPSKEMEYLAYSRAKQVSCILICPPSSAFQLVNKYGQLLSDDWQMVKKMILFIGEKLNLQDVLYSGRVLELEHRVVEQRYDALQEIGFIQITAKTITRFPFILMESIKELKYQRLIGSSHDPLEEMLKNLDFDMVTAGSIRNKLEQQNYVTNMTLNDIRQIVLVEYLSWRMGYEQETIWSFFKGKHKFMNSFRDIKECLDIVYQKINISHLQPRSSLYFLNARADNLRQILSSTFLLEMDILRIIKKHPPVMYIDKDILEERIQNLQSLKISKEQILNFPSALNLSSKTVQTHLEQIALIPELHSLKLSPSYLRIVYHFERAKTRLRILKSAGYIAFSVNLLLKSKLENHMISGRGDWSKGSDCIIWFTRVFKNKTTEEVKEKLKEHPSRHRISLYNVQVIMDALFSRGITMEQLWNSLYIVFYDCKLVTDYYDRLGDRPELQPFSEWQNHARLLDLVVYYIEKENNINGIFYGPIMTSCEEEVPSFTEAEFSVSKEEDALEGCSANDLEN